MMLNNCRDEVVPVADLMNSSVSSFHILLWRMALKHLFSLLICGNLYFTFCDFLHVCQREENRATLTCGKLSTGKVTWSRDINGQNVDILTTHNGDMTRHLPDPDRRYGSGADIVLIILRVSQSDAGRYYCNGTTVELTVLPTDCPNASNSMHLDSQSTSTQSSSTSTTTEDSTNKDTGGEMGVEVALRFGGVGLVALVFLLVTVAAGRVVLLQAWQAGRAAERHGVQLSPSQ